jgi:hypothetical protein
LQIGVTLLQFTEESALPNMWNVPMSWKLKQFETRELISNDKILYLRLYLKKKGVLGERSF